MDSSVSRRSTTTKSTLPHPSESVAAPSTATTPSSMASTDDPEAPSIKFDGIQNVFLAIRNTSGDALCVKEVSTADFARILATRSESDKYRLFFFEDHRLLIVTLPSRPHERAQAEMQFHITSEARNMGLKKELHCEPHSTFATASGHSPGGSGEGDSTFTLRSPTGVFSAWPSVVLEVGFSHSIAMLRMKGRWWLEASDYAVKVVILVKFFQSESLILLEKWKAVVGDDRPGATITRRSEGRSCQPGCVQTVTISRPGVGDEDLARLDQNSYVVVSGPLKLDFAELFLRDPGPGEHDIVYDDEFLIDMAIGAWP